MEELEDLMYSTIVFTFKGRERLLDLIKAGVKYKIKYFNVVEKLLPKSRRTINQTTEEKKVVFNYGIVFTDGFEIKNVDKKVFDYVNSDIIEKRCRNPKYKPNL